MSIRAKVVVSASSGVASRSPTRFRVKTVEPAPMKAIRGMGDSYQSGDRSVGAVPALLAVGPLHLRVAREEVVGLTAGRREDADLVAVGIDRDGGEPGVPPREEPAGRGAGRPHP